LNGGRGKSELLRVFSPHKKQLESFLICGAMLSD
jgi:hypothetical protein